MADETKQIYGSREWHTGDVITADALNKIENEMEYVSAEVTNAVTGTINNQKLNDTIARKLDSIVKYFPEEPTEENLENVRMYVQPAEDNGEITVPTISDYQTFKTNFVKPYTNKAYAVGNYVEYGDVIYKVISAITKNGNLTDDAAWTALTAQTPSPVTSIDVMQELNGLINVYTSDNQVTPERNKIWIKQQGESAEVPTYEEFTDLKNALTLNADYATVTPTINDTYTGVTCVYESENVIKLYGTSTATRRVLFLNGQNALRTSSLAFMQTVGAGEYDVSVNITGYLMSNDLSVQYTYTTFASGVSMVSLAVPTKHVSLTQPAMVGLSFSTGVNFGTSDNPTYVEFHMTRTVSNDLLPSVDIDSTDETGKTDMAPAIMAMLKQTGHCHLGTGIYYVSGIDMPDNSMLSGCGKGTVIRLLQSVSTGYAVKMGTHNTLANVCISGADAAPVRTSQGTRTGVLYAANHDGATDGTTAYDTERCIIDNVWIENFTDSGLKCHNTANVYRKGLYATNLMLYACWCGLNIDYISEFNKFVNVQTAFCTYGCRNNGGNNTFTSCTFYGTSVAFYIDGTQPNAAHGALIGCTLCHSGSNAGSAITIVGAIDGFVISGCQIWYNTINLTNSNGIVFSGCEFGRDADISISGGALVMFDGCVWMYDSTYPPVISVTNNNKVKFTGCYGAESGNEITGN